MPSPTSSAFETTIEDLRALARDTALERAPVDLADLLGGLERRWHGSFARAGRRLTVDAGRDVVAPTVSAAALAHVLDVLVDKAHRHGVGDVSVRVQALRGAVSVAVHDQGRGVADPTTVFERRPSSSGGIGIGLALARRHTEAEGGRLGWWAPARGRRSTWPCRRLPRPPQRCI